MMIPIATPVSVTSSTPHRGCRLAWAGLRSVAMSVVTIVLVLAGSVGAIASESAASTTDAAARASSQPGPVGNLAARVEQAILDARIGQANVAVSVRDIDRDQVMIDINGRTPMIPASNMKLLSSGAALHVLGADFQFATKMIVEDDVLYVIGDGDPGLGDPTLLRETVVDGKEGLSPDEFLGLLARAVQATGIETLDSIVIDDRIFDRTFIHPTWSRDQLNMRWSAEVAGLNFHLNVLSFYPEPRAGGRPVAGRVQPDADGLVSITSRASGKTNGGNTAYFARPPKSNNLQLRGNITRPYRSSVDVTVTDMPKLFGQLLTRQFEKAGVSVGSTRVIDLDAPVPTGDVVGPVIRTPISTALTRCNTDSQNLYAEALARRGAADMTREPGSWLGVETLIRHAVRERLGSSQLLETLTVADGSGLSRRNLVSPALLTAWLASFARDDALRDVYIASLAEGGVSGTLNTRLEPDTVDGAIVRAKTGHINGVSCLSGYIIKGEQIRVFSVLVNNLPGSTIPAKRLQESIVELVANDMPDAVMVTAPVDGG